MIWRILATIGAFSFIVTGITVLSDPSCLTADFGGGRVIGVTCHSDPYGATSGTTAGIFLCLAGIGGHLKIRGLHGRSTSTLLETKISTLVVTETIFARFAPSNI